MHYTLTHATARMARALQASFQALQRWYWKRRTTSALRALSDAELKDIGIYRCAISEIIGAQWADRGRA